MGASIDYATTAVTRDAYIIRALKLAGIIDDAASVEAEMLSDGVAGIKDLSDMWASEGQNLNVNHESEHVMPTASKVLGTDGTTTYTCIKPLLHPTDDSARPSTGALWTSHFKAYGDGGVAWARAVDYVCVNEITIPTGLLLVKDAFLRDVNGHDTKLDLLSESDYLSLANKFVSGRPHAIWIKDQPWNARKAYFYPSFPDQTTHVIHINGIYLMGNFTSASTELDAPGTARLAFLYDLAALLADMYQRYGVAKTLGETAQAFKKNFFRNHRKSKSTVSQVAPRFASDRLRRW